MESENEEDLIEQLICATTARNIREVEHIIQAGIDPSTPTKKDGCSPMHTAAVLESPAGPEIVSRMLFYGANPHVKTPTGLSPLHIAAMWGRYETINVLLDNGADVADKDEDDMSALDYAEDAEKNREQCIDALTRYRMNTKRGSGCFLTKSRLNLNRILGGHVEFSTFLSDQKTEDNSVCHNISECSQDDVYDIMSDVSLLNAKVGKENKPPAEEKHKKIKRLFSPNVTLNETLFQSCNETILYAVTSTLLEDPLLSDVSTRSLTENISSKNCSASTTTNGYAGDISHNPGNDVTSSDSVDETFWSVRSSSHSSPLNRNDNDDNAKLTERGSGNDTDENGERILPPIRRKTKHTKMFVPLSPSTFIKENYQEEEKEEKPPITIDNCSHRHKKQEKEILIMTPSSNAQSSDLYEDRMLIENLSKILIDEEENSEILNVDLGTEDTINYSNKSVTELIEYYEDPGGVEYEFDPKEETLSESPSKSPRPSQFIVVNCREDDLPMKQRRSIDELSTITISYDWKDISQLRATEELEEAVVSVPSSILALTNVELKERLISQGERPGPITDTTRKIYQKCLNRIENGLDHHRAKTSSEAKFKDYTPEMRQILLGAMTLSKQKGEDLEQEMAFTFDNPEKHTWREGTQKTSFNYILLDPRVTKNLPDCFESMTLLEQLSVFTAAIFYIGKGKRSRPYEHFHEAVKFERNESKNKTASNKINMILDVWNSGYGVATIHMFHSVIPVEAYTREACMIEAMSLSRLTNAKHGDFYGPATSWAIKKKRLLGIHLLIKVLKIYLIEGEKQIKQRDLVK